MRELGREGMDFAYYLLAVHSQQGIFASSSGRTYIKEQFGNWSNCPSGLSWIGYGYGVPGHAGKGITPTACLITSRRRSLPSGSASPGARK